ncbi:nicotinate-nucleotide--dimethylbenzimidazole phosphoribosyltransferase [Zhongshania marina]|jgi:nicotinate-nucleotide--dimethylbenzimidazole phosphoribosyltransferase|uniref:Nicotinate-nucleotide--dimethylbenzimidazole phosphoribosyltransferase n=1 Tax=Zhongshania marina TaxID=2304603 RepID=A0A2S4HJA5_9GAMM|nr:nicotinate-nucleotide--dimethylbenzimidazole phosphoribosyltransferase [Marortus luteolus]POP54075.1 nicotinate-nucleotide--dimethylbenzimidazole phosphoribosyltransferase [Marortus luteolus]
MSHWYEESAPEADEEFRAAAQARQASLTKPLGALGRLEDVAIQLSAVQRTLEPHVDKALIAVFAGDHGVTTEDVSAYPQSVTSEMVRNFANGGAAISVLAKAMGVDFKVINVGTVYALEDLPNVLDMRVSAGTQNMCVTEAMTMEQCEEALEVGRSIIDQAGDIDVFVGGEMGIGNSTSAAALAVAHTRLSATAMVGRGTGINDQMLAKKSAVVTRAMSRHLPHMKNGMEVIRRIGGYEINALVGAYIRAAQKGIAVIVDGYICTAAAMSAVRINPSIRPWLFFSHCSAEPGHSRLLNKMEAEPLLQLDMRLGEGSGAALALPIMQAACRLQKEMASFEQAGVSRGSN